MSRKKSTVLSTKKRNELAEKFYATQVLKVVIDKVDADEIVKENGIMELRVPELTDNLKESLGVLLDYGITEIPVNYFLNLRNDRDLDERVKELIQRKLMLDEFSQARAKSA